MFSLLKKQRRQLAAIAALNLQDVRRDLTDPEQYNFSEDRAENAIKGYRMYLEKCVKQPDHHDNPEKDVDAAWHAHILRTRKYRKDCHAIFGRYLDHFPDTPVPAHQQDAATCGLQKATCGLHATCFGSAYMGVGY